MVDDNVRIVIRIGEAVVEVEGPQSYVDKKLQDPDSFGALITKISGIEKLGLRKRERKATTAKETKTQKPRRKRDGYEIVKDLSLVAEGDKPSLKGFYSEKGPRSNYERNVVFCYYLRKIKEIKPIGINHVYTCYKEVNQRVGDLIVSLSETSAKGWLDTSNMDDIGLPIRGENYVEYDLPKVKKAK